MTAARIAEQLEVTPRTVYRDIAVLQARRVPIEGEAGIGYVMRAGYDLPPLMFDAEEIEALIVGLRLLGRVGDKGLVAAAARISDKLYEVLPDQRTTQVNNQPLMVSEWSEVPTHHIDVAMLRQSIREEKKLSIDYKDVNAVVTCRTLQPIAIIYYIDALVLVAWCELRMGFRHFRIDRIQHCEVLDESFAGEGERLRHGWREIHEVFTG